MSGKPNEWARFEKKDERFATSSYDDFEGNRWRVDVQGDPDMVQWFVDNRPCHCHAKSHSHKRDKGTPTPQTALNAPQSMDSPSDEASSTISDMRSDPSGENTLPSEVRITLEKLTDPSKPYTVSFEIDPVLREHQSLPHHFILQGDDITANVICTAQLGTVTLSVVGMDVTKGPGDNIRLIIPNMPRQSTVTFFVNWAGGSPSYTLSGDIDVA